jgi:cytochrome c biogenesis protein CcdA
VSEAPPPLDLVRLALAVAAGRAAEAVRHAAGRVAVVAAAAVVVAGCAIGAVGCALAALWIYALPRVGAVGAPLIVAAVLAALGGGVILLLRYYKPRPRRVAPHAAPGHAALLGDLAGLAGLSDVVRAQKGPVLLAAFLAGLMAGGKDR